MTIQSNSKEELSRLEQAPKYSELEFPYRPEFHPSTLLSGCPQDFPQFDVNKKLPGLNQSGRLHADRDLGLWYDGNSSSGHDPKMPQGTFELDQVGDFALKFWVRLHIRLPRI